MRSDFALTAIRIHSPTVLLAWSNLAASIPRGISAIRAQHQRKSRCGGQVQIGEALAEVHSRIFEKQRPGPDTVLG